MTRSRIDATSKMERWKPLTIITKRSILDVAAVLDPSLVTILARYFYCSMALVLFQFSVKENIIPGNMKFHEFYKNPHATFLMNY